MKIKQKRLSASEKQKAISLYQDGQSSLSVATYFNVSKQCILQLLRKNKIERRNLRFIKYYKDESYFDNIDTDTKAYVLGLFYSDGCNDILGNKIILSLHKKDINLLNLVKSEMKTNQVLRLNENCLNLVICSKRLCESLYKLGCVNKKSLVLKFPTKEHVPNHLINHFIRGYFDGDGCLHITKNTGSPIVYIESSPFFLIGLQKIIKNKLNIVGRIKIRKDSKSQTFCISGVRKCLKFLNFIYDNSNIYLERKRAKYNKVYNWYIKKIIESDKIKNKVNSSPILLSEII